jgi:hypothetical protein
MDNYFQVIDGIKYDTAQATAICKGEFTKERSPGLHYKYRKFRKPLLIYTNIVTDIYNYIIYKGVNGGYFMYSKLDKQYKKIDHLDNNKTTLDKTLYIKQAIKPLTRDESIDYYFNGYQYPFNSCESWITSWDHVVMIPVISEEEAFEGIPVA